MEVTYRLARPADVPALVSMRAAFLAEVSGANPTEPALLQALSRYFSTAVATGDFSAYLALAGDCVIATSGLIYHRYPPSARNPEGLEAYVMNMYTLPEWRGQGIASTLLQMLIARARESNCRRIRLHAHPKAVPVYARAHFVQVESEMLLDLR